MYTATDIALYIVDYCINIDRPVTNLKLQYILLILNDRYKNETGHTLFTDNIAHGSRFDYVPSVYYRFCQFGFMPITLNNRITLLPSDVTEFIHKNITDIIKIPPCELVDHIA